MNDSLSQRHEREVAEVIPGGRQVLASGALLDKHDVSTSTKGSWKFRYELKCTQQKGYRLTVKDWQELVEYVYGQSAEERPAWAIRYYDPESVAARPSDRASVIADLVVVDLNDWCELLAELETLRADKAKE